MGDRTLAGVVDLDRYPIDRLDSAECRDLVDDCRAQLAAAGVCSLPAFLTAEAVGETIDVGDALDDKVWHANQTHNVYFTDLDDPSIAELPEQHPRRRPIRSSQRAVAQDLLPPDLPVRRLYDADAFLRFLEAVLERAPLYRSVDPLDAVEMSHFRPGDELGWHFDNSEFSVTVMLREPDAGGDFEWFRDLRTDDDDGEMAVWAALDGESGPPRVLPTGPGTLAIFQGRHALHRVTPVEGKTTRTNMVFTLGAEPNMRLSPLTQQLFYGRTVV